MAAKTPPPRRPTSSRSAKKPATSRSRAAARKPSNASNQRSNLGATLSAGYLGVSHFFGGIIRAFSTEKLSKEDRRDGAPFFLLLLSISGAANAWFLIGEPWALALHNFTFGMLFGLVAYALPVVFFGYALYLFRHPASVKDSSRFALGFWLLLSVISGFFHVFSTMPSPREGVDALAEAGGLFGWLVGGPLAEILSIYVAVPALVLLSVIALLVMTGTAPNKIIANFKRLYGFLFAENKNQVETDAFDAKKSSWWKKERELEPAFDSPLVSDIDEFVAAEIDAPIESVDVAVNGDDSIDEPEFFSQPEGVTEPIDIPASERANDPMCFRRLVCFRQVHPTKRNPR